MGRRKLKSLIFSFTAEGDFLAILYPDGTVRIWNTGNGDLFAEWKDSDADSDVCYSSISCNFVGKKRKKERVTFLLALGTSSGGILVVNIITGEKKWTSNECHPGGTTGLCFANKGHTLHTVGSDGMASELDSETGELIGNFKASRTAISSLALSCDEKILAVAGAKIHVFSFENKNMLHKFSTNSKPVQYITISDGAKAVVSSGPDEKQLQVWGCDSNTRSVTSGAVLHMRHPPVVLECKNSCKDEDGLVILSVSESGIAYVWDLKTILQDEVIPTRITVKSIEEETRQQKRSAEKSRIPIIAARLNALEKDGRVSVLIAYGSLDCPQFSSLDITDPGVDIFITATHETLRTVTRSPHQNGDHKAKENLIRELSNLDVEVADATMQKKKVKKKRTASDLDLAAASNTSDAGDVETPVGPSINDDLNEPTMGEKLASLNFPDNDKANSSVNQESSHGVKPPSADSVHVLLKQALHADDHALLLECLYTQDEKVITNSTSRLNSADVLKLLDSLISIIHSRGAVLACALPWLRILLVQHASGIMSQESSLLALNSIYQMIESRVSTFRPALELSSCLDYLFSGISDDAADEVSMITPIIYEDNDESDEEPEDTMETDQESEELVANGFSHSEGSHDMSDSDGESD